MKSASGSFRKGSRGQECTGRLNKPNKPSRFGAGALALLSSSLLLACQAPPPPPSPPRCNVVLSGANQVLVGRGTADDGHPIATAAVTYGPSSSPPLSALDGPNSTARPHQAFAETILVKFDALDVKLTARTHRAATRTPVTEAESTATSTFTLDAPARCRIQIDSEAPLVQLKGARAGYFVESEITEVGDPPAQLAVLAVRYDFRERPDGQVDVLTNGRTTTTIPNGQRFPLRLPSSDLTPAAGFNLEAGKTYQLFFRLVADGDALAQTVPPPPQFQARLDAKAVVKLVP